MHKLIYYVPEENLEQTKSALFAAGVGKFSNYKNCCWQTKGVGQFEPCDEANPHIGAIGQLEKVEEYRVEMLCPDNLIEKAIAVLIAAHPYEEVAYEAFRLDYFPQLKSK